MIDLPDRKRRAKRLEWAIAAAQSSSITGDVVLNVDRHIAFVTSAITRGVRIIVFPELSLSGYEPEVARQSALAPNDPRLAPLRALAKRAGIVVVAGAPYVIRDGRLQIGAFAFLPKGSVVVYTKEFLHAGEDAVFLSGCGGRPLRIDREIVALAVCADAAHPEHASAAAQQGATLYAAGMLVTESGYDRDTEQLRRYARDHMMTVLMANHGAPTGAWNPAGKSAIWTPGGHELIKAPAAGDVLVMATRAGSKWRGEIIQVK